MVCCKEVTLYLDKVRRLPPVRSCLKLFMAVLCPPDFRMTWERMCLMKQIGSKQYNLPRGCYTVAGQNVKIPVNVELRKGLL